MYCVLCKRTQYNITDRKKATNSIQRQNSAARLLQFTCAIRKTPSGLLRSYAPIFAHKKALPPSLCIRVIPHASMIIT